MGGTFVPVDGSTQYRLSDVTVQNVTPGELFQLVNAENLMNLDGTYSYVTPEFAEGDDTLVGWYDLDIGGGVFDPDAKVTGDKVMVDVGRGFLVDNASGLDIKLQFAGEAPTKSTQIQTSGSTYAFVASYIPRAIPLNWIVPTGAITPGDLIQKINQDNLMNLDATYSYVSPEFSEGDDTVVGWYDLDIGGGVFDPDAKVTDATLVQPNTTFLCDMTTAAGENTYFQFPSSIKE